MLRDRAVELSLANWSDARFCWQNHARLDGQTEPNFEFLKKQIE